MRYSRPKVYTYPQDFICMCSLSRLPVAKNHNFGQILIFLGLLYQPPFTDESQIWCAIADPRTVYAYVQNFVSITISLFCRPLAAKNPIAVFWTSAFSDVANVFFF